MMRVTDGDVWPWVVTIGVLDGGRMAVSSNRQRGTADPVMNGCDETEAATALALASGTRSERISPTNKATQSHDVVPVSQTTQAT